MVLETLATLRMVFEQYNREILAEEFESLKRANRLLACKSLKFVNERMDERMDTDGDGRPGNP